MLALQRRGGGAFQRDSGAEAAAVNVGRLVNVGLQELHKAKEHAAEGTFGS